LAAVTMVGNESVELDPGVNRTSSAAVVELEVL
jgi:hypothetical protein